MIPALVPTRTVARAAGRPPGTARGGAVRMLIDMLVASGVLAIVADAFLVGGLLVPTVVASGSMTPGLLGPHRRWQCAACARSFACSLESLPAPGAPAVCPNCGAACDAERGIDHGGSRVLVDRSAFVFRSPRRWETIVFRSPGEASALCVKRVVGLPGECVEIRGGDIFVDGRVATKSLAEARAMAVNVYDTPATDHRWQATAGGGWSITGGRALFRDRSANAQGAADHDAAAEGVDWLTYHHEHCFPRGRADGAPIVDDSPCDQNESRTLASVADIMLACEVRASGAGAFYLRAGSPADEFTARIEVTSGRGDLAHHRKTVASFIAPPMPLAAFARFELIVADQRARLTLAGQLLAEYDYRPSASGPSVQSVAIGARGADVEVRRLQVLRDVYYTPPRPGNPSKHWLSPNEYFLLGDNSPHAVDSRIWSSDQDVSAEFILGKALAW